MISYNEWRKENSKDENGGIVPENLKRAKKIDLITLPKDVKGTNCFNCKWVMNKEGEVRHCDHPEVKEYVNDRMCCVHWDNPGVKRPWGKSDF